MNSKRTYTINTTSKNTIYKLVYNLVENLAVINTLLENLLVIY